MRRALIKIEVQEAIKHADEISEDIFSPEWLKAYEEKAKEITTKNPSV